MCSLVGQSYIWLCVADTMKPLRGTCTILFPHNYHGSSTDRLFTGANWLGREVIRYYVFLQCMSHAPPTFFALDPFLSVCVFFKSLYFISEGAVAVEYYLQIIERIHHRHKLYLVLFSTARRQVIQNFSLSRNSSYWK